MGKLRSFGGRKGLRLDATIASGRSDMTLVANESVLHEWLLAAQGGDTAARERVAAWMLHTAHRQTCRALRTQYSSLTQSSLMSHVLVRLIRGNTMDLASDIYYLVAAISRAPRQLLIDHYRRVDRRRRHAESSMPRDLPWFQQVFHDQNIDEYELEGALEDLEVLHPRKTAVVKLRFFCEMSAARSPRHWEYQNRPLSPISDWQGPGCFAG